MVGPKYASVEGKRTTLEGNSSKLMNERGIPRIEPRQSPIAAILLRAAKDVDHVIDKGMTADLGADPYRPDNVTAGTEFQNPVVVPLTQIKTVAIVTQIRTRELRACNPFLL